LKKKEHQKSETLGNDTINNWIIPFLSVGKRGFKSNFDLASIFLLILKRLKTDVQWRELPIESYLFIISKFNIGGCFSTKLRKVA